MSKHLKCRFNLHDLLNRQGEVQTHEVARRMGVPQRKAREDLKALAATGRVRQLREGTAMTRMIADDRPLDRPAVRPRGRVRSLTYRAGHLKCEVSGGVGFGERCAEACRPTTVLSGAEHFARAIGHAGRERWRSGGRERLQAGDGRARNVRLKPFSRGHET